MGNIDREQLLEEMKEHGWEPTVYVEEIAYWASLARNGSDADRCDFVEWLQEQWPRLNEGSATALLILAETLVYERAPSILTWMMALLHNWARFEADVHGTERGRITPEGEALMERADFFEEVWQDIEALPEPEEDA
jgi:hypothetical protein